MYIPAVRSAQRISGRRFGCHRLVPALTALVAVAAVAQAPGGAGTHPGEHQHLDSRFAHNRYYYDRGDAVHSPPDEGLSNLHGPGEYQVVAPPTGLDAAGTTPSPVVAGASDQLFASPSKGQSPEQQANDRNECNQWAKTESGYDPTASDAAAQSRDKRTAYFHNEAACLGSLGYAVR